mmetsp:Transcript_2898/g.7888  ORF Transcript_2898/g.7888 Transcript_2898/m.7888 type:complete len:537 (-) Transcript_2898:1025-2635(-)
MNRISTKHQSRARARDNVWATIGSRVVLAAAVLGLIALSASRVSAWSGHPVIQHQHQYQHQYQRQHQHQHRSTWWKPLRSSGVDSRLCASSSIEPPKTEPSGETTSSRKETSSNVQKRLKEQRDRKPPKIICCSSTKELVHAVNAVVTEKHVVAELGSQLREVSNAIRARASPSSVYCDVKRDYPKAAAKHKGKTLSPNETTRINAMRLGNHLEEDHDEDDDDESAGNLDFREMDKFADWRSAFFRDSSSSSPSCRYDVLVLDVNAIVGNDLEWTCLDLILEFEQMAVMVAKSCQETDENNEYHGLKYVLVKSLGLNSVASQLTYTVPWLDPNKTNHNRLCRIVATVGVHDYRQTIPGVRTLLQQSHLKAANPDANNNDDGDGGDGNAQDPSSSFVLEVGCHFGTSTVLLNKEFDHVMGVDVGSKIIREAQKKYPGVFFRTGDAWKTAGLLRLQQEYYCEREIPSDERTIGFDAVYVDVGGLSGADGLLDTIALVKSIQYAMEPQCIVVKSLCLQRLASRFIPYWKWQKKGQSKLN